MIEINIEFYDIEFLDGYFSGTLFLFDGERRIILDYGYDVEFKTLMLKNCNNSLYNSFCKYYTSEEIADFWCAYNAHIEFRIQEYLRPSQVLYKPPMWCRIEAPHRRITIWPERTVPRKKMPVERRSVSCCRWQTSAAWMTSRICSRRPLPSS